MYIPWYVMWHIEPASQSPKPLFPCLVKEYRVNVSLICFVSINSKFSPITTKFKNFFHWNTMCSINSSTSWDSCSIFECCDLILNFYRFKAMEVHKLTFFCKVLLKHVAAMYKVQLHWLKMQWYILTPSKHKILPIVVDIQTVLILWLKVYIYVYYISACYILCCI